MRRGPSATVSGAAPAAGLGARARAPGTNRRSGSSVRTSTVTSPRSPCGLPIRPTTTLHATPPVATCSRACRRPSRVTATVDRGDRRTVSGRGRRRRSRRGPAAAGERADHGAQRGGRAAGAADDLAEVVGVHPDLEELAAAQLLAAHLTTSSGCVDDARGPGARAPRRARSGLGLRRRRGRGRRRAGVGAPRPRRSAALGASAGGLGGRRLGEPRRVPRRPRLGACGLGASAAGASAAFGRRPSWRRGLRRGPWRVLGVAARRSLTAASKISCLSALGSATRRVPSAPGRPLNFCQSPVTLRIARDGLGRLRADAEPVLRPLGVDLDERGLLRGVVLADLLDRPGRRAWCASRRRRCGSTAHGSCPCASDGS